MFKTRWIASGVGSEKTHWTIFESQTTRKLTVVRLSRLKISNLTLKGKWRCNFKLPAQFIEGQPSVQD